MGSTSCAACGAALGAGVNCSACRAAALLSLELPSAGGAPPPPPPPEPPKPEPRPKQKTKTVRRVAPTGGTRAFAATLSRAGRLDLPEACACCDGEAGVYRIESAQALAIHVPYCRTCRGHQRRPPLRAFVWFLALIGLGVLGWRLHPVAPDSFGLGAGLVLLLLLASRALSYVLVPRFGHAREGRSLWIRGFTQSDVTLAVCQESYLARLGASNPQPIRQLRRGLSRLLFGSTSVLQPLAILAAAAGLLYVLKPVPPDEKAFLAFQAAPALNRATSFVAQFGTSKHVPEIEAYVWKEAVGGRQKIAYQGYLKSFPKGGHRAEAQAALHDLAFEALEAKQDRQAALQFLREFPASPRASEARQMLITALAGSARPSGLAPPLPVLQEIFKASPGGKVRVRIDGFQDEDYGRPVEARLKEALKNLGLELQRVKEKQEAVIEVEGSNRLNTNFSYSRFGFGGGGPYGEVAEATVVVRLGGGPAAWRGRVDAKSPASVSYTTYRIGAGAPLDTGPSQHDVHSQTVPVFVEALKPLFEYR